MSDGQLKKRLNLLTLTLYGLGTTIGAGIYALVGEMAASAGFYMPVSFLIATLLAALTGLSFAELSSRYPVAAGVAEYVRAGFKRPSLALIIGLLVACAGMVSAAGIINGFVGYLQDFTTIDRELPIILIVLTMGGLACWGIKESVGFAVIITLIEVGGLIIIMALGLEDLVKLPELLPDFIPPFESAAWTGIISGSFLAFFAFIGFEDMVHVAEETKDARRTVPRAVILTIVLTAVIYVAIAIISILAVPYEQLAGHQAPLKLIFASKTGGEGDLMGYIAIVAMLNGALVQLVMASRIFYGLSKQGNLPAILGRVNAARGTPIIATVFAAGIILVLALWFTLAGLAHATSAITLGVFAVVNLSLIMIKLRKEEDQHQGTSFPIWIPIMGTITCALLLIVETTGL